MLGFEKLVVGQEKSRMFRSCSIQKGYWKPKCLFANASDCPSSNHYLFPALSLEAGTLEDRRFLV